MSLNITIITYTLIAILTTSLGAYILIKNPKKTENQLFFVWTLFITLWTIASLAIDQFHTIVSTSILAKTITSASLLGIITLLELHRRFPGKKLKISKKLILIYHAVNIYIFYLVIKLKILLPNKNGEYLFSETTKTTTYYSLFLTWIIVLFSITIFFLYKKNKIATRNEKKQIKIITYGLITFFLIAFPTAGIFPTIGIYKFELLSKVSILILVLSVYIAIAKHQAFSIKTAFHQTLIWTVLSWAIAIPIFKLSKKIQISYVSNYHNILSILPFFYLAIAFFAIIVGTYIFQKNTRKQENRIFFLLILSTSCWLIFTFFFDNHIEILQSKHIVRIMMISGILMLPIGIALFHYFPNKIRPNIYLAFFATILTAGIIYEVMTFKALHADTSGLYWLENIKRTGSFFFNPITSILLNLYFIKMLYKQYHHKKLNNKKQIKIISAGFFCFFTGALIFSPILCHFGIMEFRPFARICVIFYLLSISIAIAKAQAFDIRTALHQTILWAFLSSLIFIPIIYFRSNFDKTSTLLSNLNTFLQLLTLYLIFILYHKTIQPKIDHIFFRKKHALKKELKKIIQQITQIKSINTLTKDILLLLKTTLYPKTQALYLHHPQSIIKYQLEKPPEYYPKHTLLENPNPDSLTIPIGTPNHPIGAIILDEKKTLQAYTIDEKKFLKDLASNIALHIENTILYDTLNTQTQELLATQTTIISTEKQTALTKEKEENIKDLSYLISHEVKNALYSINAIIDALKNDSFNSEDEKRKVLSSIHDQCKRLNNFAEKYLVHEQLSLGLTKTTPTTFDLPEIINQVITELKPSVNGKNLIFKTNLKSTVPITTDKEKLQIILTNLIQNAIEYTHPNTEITITTKETPLNISLIIKDQGPGIPKKIKTNKNHHISTGIGLNICKKISHLLGIKFTITTNSKIGTSIELIFKKNKPPIF